MNFETNLREFDRSYSWKTWFKSLDFQQLEQLRNRWLQILPLTKGFEYQVLTWDINQVTYELARQLREAS